MKSTKPIKVLTCIGCPKGCQMQITETADQLEISGNGCQRGLAFARDEWLNPQRTISSTVRTIYKEVPVLPVRVAAEIPKTAIFSVMQEINQVLVRSPVARGEAIIADVCGLGVDVIATSNVLMRLAQTKKKDKHPATAETANGQAEQRTSG